MVKNFEIKIYFFTIGKFAKFLKIKIIERNVKKYFKRHHLSFLWHVKLFLKVIKAFLEILEVFLERKS